MEDRRLPAVMMAIAHARSHDVDRRDADFIAEIRRAALEYLAVYDAICVAGKATWGSMDEELDAMLKRAEAARA